MVGLNIRLAPIILEVNACLAIAICIDLAIAIAIYQVNLTSYIYVDIIMGIKLQHLYGYIATYRYTLNVQPCMKLISVLFHL